MANKRWEEVIEKFAEHERYCLGSDILYREDVVKLLARQHAAMVRKINVLCTANAPDRKTQWGVGYRQDCDDILSALAKQGNGGR